MKQEGHNDVTMESRDMTGQTSDYWAKQPPQMARISEDLICGEDYVITWGTESRTSNHRSLRGNRHRERDGEREGEGGGGAGKYA